MLKHHVRRPKTGGIKTPEVDITQDFFFRPPPVVRERLTQTQVDEFSPIEDYTIKELRDIARNQGIKGAWKMRRADLEEALR
jgi:hypothetical protein